MENIKYVIEITKEDAEKFFIPKHGGVAKVFLDWKYSLDEANKKSPHLRQLDGMMEIYKINDRNVGLIPNINLDVDLSEYKILFKELDKFKIQKMRDNHLGNDEISNKPKNN